MELALSLGDAATPFTFLDKTPKIGNKDLGFCMALGNGFSEKKESRNGEDFKSTPSADPPVQLDLLPSVPVPRTHTSSQFRFPWLADNVVGSEPGSSEGPGKGLDVNRLPMIGTTEEAEDGAALSSPNSTVSSFHMDFGVKRSKRDMEAIETERPSSRASDDEENGSTRKKLRLSKEQSAFLEESFKEHSTLNPKQKDALAKQLNLRPRQVEVWFQNRRARTKLKQTEVDCEYLKRCCETLTEENRRLQKELQELRALKTSQPFYMQLPATTLTMCPSCERVATATTTTVSSTSSAITTTANPSAMSATTTTTTTALSLAKPRTTIQQHHHPFSHLHANKAAASLYARDLHVTCSDFSFSSTL